VRPRLTRRHAPPGAPVARLRWWLDAFRARVDDGISQIERALADWISEPRDRPFFWFANLMECHSPYLPPRPYNDLGPLQRVLAVRDAARIQAHDGFVAASLGQLRVSDASVRRMTHLYKRAVRSMDDFLGRLLTRLEDAKLLNDTILVVVSDHGENLGECGLYSHILSLDDRLIRVPFVLGGGVTVEQPRGPMSLSRLPAILAAAIGLREHPWGEVPDDDALVVAQYDGFSAMTPEIAERLADAFSLSDEHRSALSTSGECITDGRFKLVRLGGIESMYDMKTDPLETTDVLSTHPIESARLRSALDRVESTTPRVVGDPSDGVRPDTKEQQDLEERMRILGYL
jgi:arylsulfatase A-like enzyme